jgi:predicted adenine nucleotide alpha hydrolase (AANH) superfamily ATPase
VIGEGAGPEARRAGAPGESRRVLLHACCGPCLLEPYDELARTHDLRVVFANPNIQPREEYVRRRDTLLEYARSAGIEVDELPYEPATWDAAVAGLEADTAERCRACFRLRMGLAAGHAADAGFEMVATTLTVSPYQDQEALRAEGIAACEAAGVEFLVTDFRDRYPEAVRRSRELGMYRQDFCGCRYSVDEAEAARSARRAKRRG